MTQESKTQETTAQPGGALAPEPGELTDAELALVAGGNDRPPPTTGTSNGRS